MRRFVLRDTRFRDRRGWIRASSDVVKIAQQGYLVAVVNNLSVDVQ
jgi:hypothetical protein